MRWSRSAGVYLSVCPATQIPYPIIHLSIQINQTPHLPANHSKLTKHLIYSDPNQTSYSSIHNQTSHPSIQDQLNTASIHTEPNTLFKPIRHLIHLYRTKYLIIHPEPGTLSKTNKTPYPFIHPEPNTLSNTIKYLIHPSIHQNQSNTSFIHLDPNTLSKQIKHFIHPSIRPSTHIEPIKHLIHASRTKHPIQTNQTPHPSIIHPTKPNQTLNLSSHNTTI